MLMLDASSKYLVGIGNLSYIVTGKPFLGKHLVVKYKTVFFVNITVFL